MKTFSLLRQLTGLPYGMVMALRNWLFDRGILRSTSLDLPVICVGNLAVGGTGKTPHTEYLVRLLSGRGLRCAVLSRGYGRSTRGYRKVGECAAADECGDEPWQMQQVLGDRAQCYVCEDRVEGARRILADGRPDVLILDDAYQHRYIRAGHYVLLTDYARLYTDDYVLPAGRLREFRRGACRADTIVVTKCPPDLSREAASQIRNRLHPQPGQRVFFSSVCYGGYHRLTDDVSAATLSDTCTLRALALSGIAHPQPFVRHLCGDFREVDVLAFPDHHAFTDAELAHIAEQAAAFDVVVTTAKDAARLSSLRDRLPPDLCQKLWVLPIHVAFLDEEDRPENDTFSKTILRYVTENSRNSCLD